MKLICIGRNYVEHARELKNPLPDKAVFFLKPDSSIVRGNKPFFYPEFSKEIQHEVEVVFRINKVGKKIKKEFAHRYYDAIGLGIDFTARDLQDEAKKKGLPWEIAKAFDYSAPLSKLISVNKVKDIRDINFRLDINGKTLQKGNTREMIFAVDELIAYVSQFMTLKMGDLLFTGTPEGVGPVKIGDRLQAYLEDRLMLDFYVR